jgi:G3E family GTPase
MVITQELQNVTAMGRRDIRYQTGPLITLVDVPRFSFMWAERRQLIIGQINGADIVALSRSDMIEDIYPDDIRNELCSYRNEIDLLSVHDSGSLENIMMAVPELMTP